jgi:Dyp-type peroxidase family
MKLDLADIQANVLRSYNLPVARYLFVNLTDAARARTLLGRLVPLVTNAQAWDTDKPVTTFNIGLTRTGLTALGLPPGSLNTVPLEFLEGMITRGPVLGDIGPSDQSLWEPLWRGRIDMWMSINAGSPAALEHIVEVLKRLLSETEGAELVGVQDAAALTVDGKPLGTEHFGYADGFSQPNFVGGQAAEVPGAGKMGKHGRWQDIEAGEFILGHRSEAAELPVAPSPPVLAKNGTFLVFRKLEQDVARFRAYVAKVGAQYPGGPEKLMAKLVGRWRDGTPLALSPDTMNPAVALDPSRTNNFTYGDDPEGLKCPIGSHIRRTNPRDSNGFEGKLATRRRILRRGLPYGTYALEGEENDGRERGIIFMALNASIARQFEFVQQQWVNYGNDFKQGEARDPLIGGNEGAGRFVIPGDNARGEETFICADLPNFVTLRGGGYFFLPSLTALRLLAADCIDPR